MGIEVSNGFEALALFYIYFILYPWDTNHQNFEIKMFPG